MKTFFDWTAVALTALAAVLWFFSAGVPAPPFETTGSHVSPLNDWAKKTARRNRWAARPSTAAALAQAISLLIGK